MARDVWNFVVGPEIGAGEGRWPSAVCGLDLDHLPRPHTRAQRSAHEPLACVRAQLVVLLAEVGKLEDSKAPHGMGSLLQRANAMIETRYNTKTLPLYGSPYQEDPPPASAGNAEGVKMVERTIGFKKGTGGSPGVAYLREPLFKPLFPDLWAIRTEL